MKRILIILFFCTSSIFTQVAESNIIDSLANITIPDSLKIDSLKTPKKYDIDEVVKSSASDSLIFDIKSKKMYLYGKGKINYKNTNLNSGKIKINFETNDLEADGLYLSDSLKETPILAEAGETYEGTSIKYNFKTQKGFISVAKNAKGEARYEGAKVNKVDKDIYFIEDGIYTTCPEDPPHTHFSAKKMKIIQGDKVFAQWVFMHIAGVPLPIPLPFAVFPTESGRRSGLIIPTYSSSANLGQSFRNFGYFFALSDYYDWALTGDYYTKGGFAIHNRVRYRKRYAFSGNVNLDYSNTIFGEVGDPDRSERKEYRISVSHNQQFNPTTSLNMNLSFQSSSYLNQNSLDYNDVLKQNITSRATLNKRWESGNSININYSRTQNLSTGNISEDLPNVSFNKKLVYPFKSDNSSTGKNQKWYEQIGYSYSGRFKNQRKKTDGDLKIRGGFDHNIASSFSSKVGYFNVSPRISYRERWYNKRTTYEKISIATETAEGVSSKDTVVQKDLNELNFVRTFDFSLSASTKLYGILQPNMMGIEAFRHTILPSISYNYTPDFSEDLWGYYDSYTDVQGNEIKYDKFGREIFSGVTAGESQNISFSLGNIFELKTIKDPTDTTSQSKKIQLLNFDIGTSYNFAADSNKLSNLRLNFRTQIGDLLSFNGNSSFTFYNYNGGNQTNSSLISEGRGLFRMLSFNLSASTRLSGDKLKGEDRTGKNNEKGNDENEDGLNNRTNEDNSIYGDKPNDFSIPWNLSLDMNYNFNKRNPQYTTQSSSIGLNLGFNLTKNWKFTVRGSYDLENKKVGAPQITVYRDLGCWEMNFNWNPMGSFRGYRFEIRLKAPELQDIKVTKSGGQFIGR